jgi:hypothetical protein
MSSGSSPQSSAVEPRLAPDEPLDEIVILSAPRSGTNYFCECMNAFPEVHGFHELFNPNAAFGLGRRIAPDVGKQLGLDDVEVATDPRLTRIFHDDPLRALRAVTAVSREMGATTISYKIFPRQLPMEKLEQIIDDDHRHVVFMVRRRLDVYISYQKAVATGSYTQTSTAEVKPTIDVEDFLAWARRTDEWYDACFDLVRARGRKISIARYRTDINLPKRVLLERTSEALAYHGVTVTLPERRLRRKFQRQDKNVGPFMKIANGDELRAALRERKALKYGMGSFLGQVAADYPFVREDGPDQA